MDGYRLESGDVSIGYERAGSLEKLRVPCGACFGCRMEYADMWSIRLMHEAKCWRSNIFVTLTYEDIPWHGSLAPHDLQKWLKRFRKAVNGLDEAPDGTRPIRYFACGEYGGTTGRPHFHVALFNSELRGRHRGQSMADEIGDTWTAGSHHLDDFTPGRARYIAGYATKKVRSKLGRERRYGVCHPETGEWVERIPEFVRMSRRPGIGAYWFEKYSGDLQRGYVTLPGGIKKRIPRFYFSKLMDDASFAEEASEKRAVYLSELVPGDDSEQRRRDKELVHASRVGAYGTPRGL